MIDKTVIFEKSVSINLDNNKLNIKSVDIVSCGDHLVFNFNGDNQFSFGAGNGYYVKSKFNSYGIKRKISGLMPLCYEESLVSCYYLYDGNKLNVVMRNHNTPLIQNVVFTFDGDKCILNINDNIINGYIK